MNKFNQDIVSTLSSSLEEIEKALYEAYYGRKLYLEMRLWTAEQLEARKEEINNLIDSLQKKFGIKAYEECQEILYNEFYDIQEEEEVRQYYQEHPEKSRLAFAQKNNLDLTNLY